MKKKIIYAVNRGSYSDYRIVALFTTKNKAKEYMKFVTDDYYNDIEEYELNPKIVDLVKRGYSIWLILMLKDGTTELIERHNFSRYESYEDFQIRKRSIENCLQAKVIAKTEKQAIKITNEHRVQMIANNKWID